MQISLGNRQIRFLHPQTLRATGALSLPDIPGLAAVLGIAANRPDIQAERRMAEGAGLAMKAARRKMYPEPIVSGGLKSPVVNNQRDSGYVISVSIPLPLFDRGKADIARAEIARNAAEARAEALSTEVQLKLRGAWEETQARLRAVETYQKRAGKSSVFRSAQRDRESVVPGPSFGRIARPTSCIYRTYRRSSSFLQTGSCGREGQRDPFPQSAGSGGSSTSSRS